MSRKDQAIELIDKMLFTDIVDMTSFCAKQCAIICIDEQLKVLRQWGGSFMGKQQVNELLEIKEELNKL